MKTQTWVIVFGVLFTCASVAASAINAVAPLKYPDQGLTFWGKTMVAAYALSMMFGVAALIAQMRASAKDAADRADEFQHQIATSMRMMREIERMQTPLNEVSIGVRNVVYVFEDKRIDEKEIERYQLGPATDRHHLIVMSEYPSGDTVTGRLLWMLRTPTITMTFRKHGSKDADMITGMFTSPPPGERYGIAADPSAQLVWDNYTHVLIRDMRGIMTVRSQPGFTSTMDILGTDVEIRADGWDEFNATRDMNICLTDSAGRSITLDGFTKREDKPGVLIAHIQADAKWQ
ncbi:hypothetical protein BH09PLA1_BH09PLA1_01430 [soil metagenome]